MIAGAGPAGLTCAIYAARAGLRALMVERAFAGGQMSISSTIENYPGYENDTPGASIANSMKLQAERLGAEIVTEDIKSMELDGKVKKVITAKNEYESKTVVLAMGAIPRTLKIPGVGQLVGSGVSYCATCDGAFFKGKPVAVVGGGNTAVEDALYLANLCDRVHLIHRRMEFRAQHALVERAKQTPNIELVQPCIPASVDGEFFVEGITVEDVNTQDQRQIPVNAVFFAVGQLPKSDLVKGVVETDAAGYIIAGEDCKTNIEGVFVAGDIRTKRLRQIVTATADGACACAAAEEYLFKY